MQIPKVFISYSHDSEEHKKWVLEFATMLRNNGINATIDQWDLKLGYDVPTFMEKNLANSDYILLVCTDQYVEKANSGVGGVGYEKMIITSQLIERIASNKIIPIVRQNGTCKVPTFLKTKLFIDLSDPKKFNVNCEKLIRTLSDTPLHAKPNVGSNPFNNMSREIDGDKLGDAVKITRRKFVKWTIFGVGVVYTAVTGISSILNATDEVIDAVNDLKLEYDAFAHKDAFKVFNKLDDGLQLFVGKSNILRKAGGNSNLSSYLTESCQNFSGFIKKAIGEEIPIHYGDPDDAIFEINPTQNYLFLGGPVANQLTAQICEYKYIDTKDGKPIPVFNTDSKNYRWGFYCGDTDGYGFYKGKCQNAFRYDANKSEPRPLYGIYDLQESRQKPIFFGENNKWLNREALIITRLKFKSSKDRYIVIVGGVHGYSTQAFSRNLIENLESLSRLVGKCEEYQAFIPVDLCHEKIGELGVTTGQLCWKDAKVHLISKI
jgi:hypothetical protein